MMEVLQTFRKSAGGRYPITVTWSPPAGDSIESVGISAGACVVPTEGEFAPSTVGNVTQFWVEGGTADVPGTIILTPETVDGVLEPQMIRMLYV